MNVHKNTQSLCIGRGNTAIKKKGIAIKKKDIATKKEDTHSSFLK